MRLRAVVVILASVFWVSCTSVTETAQRGDDLAEAGKLQEAEQVYANGMNSKQNSIDEWQYLFEQRCDVRSKILTQQIAQMKQNLGKTSVQEIEKWRSYALKCPDFIDDYLALVALGIDKSQMVFEASVKPMAKRDKVGALAAARSLTPSLPNEHPLATWLKGQRKLLSQSYQAQAKAHPSDHTIATLVLEMLQSHVADPSIKAKQYQEAQKKLKAFQKEAGARALVGFGEGKANGGNECHRMLQKGAYAPAVEPSDPSGYKLPLTATLTLTNCSRGTKIVDDKEFYTVEEVKRVRVKVTERVKVTKYKPERVTECDRNIGSCVRYTKRTAYQDSQYVDRYKDVERKTKVTKSRPIKRGRSFVRVQGKLRVKGPTGGTMEYAISVDLAQTTKSFTRLGQPTNYLLRESQANASGLVRKAERQLRAQINSKLDASARPLRANAVIRQMETNPPSQDAKLNMLLYAWVVAPAVYKQNKKHHAFTTKALQGVALEGYSVDKFEPFPAYSWLPEDVPDEMFEQDLDLIPSNDRVLVLGYTPIQVRFGAAYGQAPQGLLGQPDRSYFGLNLQTQFRHSFMTGENHQGLGVMLGYGAALTFGSRLGDDYSNLSTPNSDVVVYREDEESGTAAGLGGRAMALAGFRIRLVGLFAGLMGRYDLFSMGFYETAGGMIPLAARLELRFFDRYPIFVEGWYGNVLSSTNDSQGLSLEVPLGKHMWLGLAARQEVMPAEFFGLNQNDPVRLEQARMRRFVTGIHVGF